MDAKQEALKPIEAYKNEIIMIAHRMVTPIGGAGSPMGRIVERLAIDACKAHGWS